MANEEKVGADAPEVSAPAEQAEVTVPAASKFDVVSTELRPEKGAEVLRLKQKPQPDVLQDLYQALVSGLKAAKEKALAGFDPTKRPDPAVVALEDISIRYDKEPKRRVRLSHAVNTYVVIAEEKGKLVVRCYAHIPAAFSNAATGLIKGTGVEVEFSKDSFIRPTGI